VLSDGQTLDAELVVMATGYRPLNEAVEKCLAAILDAVLGRYGGKTLFFCFSIFNVQAMINLTSFDKYSGDFW